VSAVVALARIAVGVIVERRRAQSPWIDFIWKPVSVLVGVPDASPWTPLSQDEGGATFYAGAAEIALYRTETANYRDNLAGGEAKLWVALRPTGSEPPYEIFAVTADPAEGEAWSETGSDLVDAVSMPAAVQAEIAGFIAAHHVERPFYKRQRDEGDAKDLPRKGSLRKAPP
jgi:hypothetical protein